MTSFVLVHGGAHGAWCWDRVIPHLDADRRVADVLAIDLPGRDARRDEPPSETIAIADFVDAVVADVEARGLEEVILVGHSLAGLTIGPAAARLGARMRRLVHLSTSVPAPGSTLDDVMADPRSPLSRDVDFATMFCNDLDDDTTAWLLSHLGPEPVGPMHEVVAPVDLPADLPITYVVLERDEALPPDLQREQAERAGAHEIVSFDSGHSVFASRPRELAGLLLSYT